MTNDNKQQKPSDSTDTAIAYRTCYKPLFFAEKFEAFFLNDFYKTSSDNGFRNRYEVCMAEIDYWINSLNLEIDNDFKRDGDRFKKNMFYHLKKMGWKTTKIKGRWSKTVFL